jgi:pimeloyl-ACP methyl ester carboxylesterase
MGPKAALVVVPGAGHALLPEQPKATAQALIGFAQS